MATATDKTGEKKARKPRASFGRKPTTVLVELGFVDYDGNPIEFDGVVVVKHVTKDVQAFNAKVAKAAMARDFASLPAATVLVEVPQDQKRETNLSLAA